MRLKNLIAPAMAAAVVLASHVSSVSAQEREQGGRRGGPPGARAEGGRFGGPGGGPGAMFGRGGPGGGDQLLVSLLGREAVREELKLDDAQLAGLRKLAERQRPERPDFDFRTASEAERAEFASRMQRQAAERAAEAKAHVEEILLPGQMERLEQIALQVQGAPALVNPDVAKELDLGDEKVAAMTKELQANAEKTREMMTTAMQERNFDGVREKAQEMRKELDEKLVSHLTSEQKAKFEEMKGPAFEMPEQTGAFGRGGPGGQRGPGGFGGGGARRGGEGGPGRGGPGRGGERRGGERDRN